MYIYMNYIYGELYIYIYTHFCPLSSLTCPTEELEMEKLSICFHGLSSPFPLLEERCPQGDPFYLLGGDSICSCRGKPAQALHCLILELVLWNPLATAINYIQSQILDVPLITVIFKYLPALFVLILNWVKIR